MFGIKYILAYLFLAINPLEEFSFDTDYGAQRCISDHCTCRVTLPSSHSNFQLAQVRTSTSVFFDENSHSLSSSQRSSVEEFLNRNPGQTRFTVVGYTDGCGTHGYNTSLSSLRSSAVADEIRRLRPGSAIVSRGMSELSRTHDPEARIVEIIVGNNLSISQIYPNIRADVYLLDASGSMSRKFDYWVEAISRSRPINSRVFISYSNRCYNGQQASSITPGGGTEIWYSYWHIIDEMRRGQTLAIISDFDSTVSLTAREARAIQEKVEERGIRVRAFIP
jgi:hypothetical protein